MHVCVCVCVHVPHLQGAAAELQQQQRIQESVLVAGDRRPGQGQRQNQGDVSCFSSTQHNSGHGIQGGRVGSYMCKKQASNKHPTDQTRPRLLKGPQGCHEFGEVPPRQSADRGQKLDNATRDAGRTHTLWWVKSG
jgi:hypothetical protein